MTPRTGQIDFIDDLLYKLDLTAAMAADEADEPSWATPERLSPLAASAMLDWLQARPR